MARGDKMRSDYEDYLVDDNLHINWYPGHMKKTRSLVKDNLKLVDVVVELLDARIPFSSKNPDIDQLAGNKPRVVILNKSDLADRAKLDKWIKYYKDQGIKAIPVDTMKGIGLNKLIDECRNATKDKMDALKEKGRKERPIRIMIVGVPNVGKSSIINKLTGRKSAVTGDKPGVTKGKQWVRLRELELLDTPGTMPPAFDNQTLAKHLAYIGSMNDANIDFNDLAYELLSELKVKYPELIKSKYDIDDLDVPALELYEKICVRRGFLRRGGEFDYERCATAIIDDFRKGRIGKIILD